MKRKKGSNPLAVNVNANYGNVVVGDVEGDSQEDLATGDTKRKRVGLDQLQEKAQGFVSNQGMPYDPKKNFIGRFDLFDPNPPPEMSTLNWNCSRLGNTLKFIVLEKKSVFIFLI